MAVVPLRAPRGAATEPRRPKIEIVTDPTPDTKTGKSYRDQDGLITIEFGSSKPDAPARPKPGSKAFDRNLALDLDDNALGALASYLIEGVEADEEGRRDWEDTANYAAAYLGIKLEEPASPVAADGTVCQVVASCMLEVSIKQWGTARAELLPVAGPVKVERIATPSPEETAAGMGHNGGPPMGGIMGQEEAEPGQPAVTGQDAAGDDLADALEKDMNWYLTKGDRGYYPDYSQMLMNRGVIGMAFREVYRCPIERKPLSRWVKAQDLIVSGNPAHLSGARRITKRAKVAQSTMRRMMASGHYRDVPLVQPTGKTSNTEIVIGESQGIAPTPTLPRDFEHTVLATYCEIGSGTNHDLFGSLAMLDEDENGKDPGYPLPYVVDLDYDSRTVLAIRRWWKEGDPDHRARRRFVKYGYIPSFGFYDWGLIHMVGNPTLAATMLQRSGVDAGLYANFPSWMQAQGPASRNENTVYRPNAGEVLKIPVTAGAKISDVLMPWPSKEPSAQSMALGSKLESDVRRLGGVIEIPVGEGRIGNTPVGTIMSYIESISQVPGAVHKDDHVAQAEEFELLRELLAEEPEVLWRGNRSPARKWQTAQELMTPDLAPAADPNTPSQIHRLTKVQGLIALSGQPQFAQGDEDGPIVNQRAVYRRGVEVLAGDDADTFVMPKRPKQQGAPPPDPKIVAAQIKAESDQKKVEGQLQGQALKHQGDMAELALENQNKQADRESEETRAALQLAQAKVKAGTDGASLAHEHIHDATQNAADRQHEVGLKAMDHAHETQQALTAPLIAPEGKTE